ncbi:hypothetical protein KKA24_03215 [Patescibacteria group bacterium]|nr:hypothetical protein [Patescibacteria group bacterium]
MKKIYILLFIGLAISVGVLCGSQIIEAKAGNSEVKLKAGNANELKEMVKEKKEELEQGENGLKEKQQNVYKNQNQVRLAVHSLLAMEDLVGAIGPKVSEIAGEFNNSLGKTIISEEKIQNKNRFIRLLLGGDKESAQAIIQEVNQNKEKVEQLKQLMEDCDCEGEVRDMFREQIMNIETEQNRLEMFATIEEEYKGIFGWFLNLFK